MKTVLLCQKKQSDAKGSELVASMEFRKREEEFDIIMVPYEELEEHRYKSNDGSSFSGILCTKSTDENYLEQRGEERYGIGPRILAFDHVGLIFVTACWLQRTWEANATIRSWTKPI